MPPGAPPKFDPPKFNPRTGALEMPADLPIPDAFPPGFVPGQAPKPAKAAKPLKKSKGPIGAPSDAAPAAGAPSHAGGDYGDQGDIDPPGDEPTPDPEPDDDTKPPRGGWAPGPGDVPLPSACPVVPIGMRGGVMYFLTPSGQFRELDAGRLTNAGAVSALFETRIDWLERAFPQHDKEGNLTGYSVRKVRDFLISRCARAGLFDPEGQVRLRGMWWDGDNLIAHAGDHLLVRGVDPLVGPPDAHRLARYGDFVYAAQSQRKIGDAAKPAPVEHGKKLLELIGRWNFRRAQGAAAPKHGTDALLLLGWVGCAFYAGALDWRPAIWLSGDRSTGKTSLRQLLEAALIEKHGVEVLTDTTPAALRQTLARHSIAVMLDEFENDADKRLALQEIVRLIRLSSTRGQGGIARGSAEQVATVSYIDAVCMGLSIVRPPLKPQDAQRITRIDLSPLDQDKARGDPAAKWVDEAAALGPELFIRMLHRWGHFRATLEVARFEMAEAGHGIRAAKQYGTLLAAAWVMTHDELIDDMQGRAWLQRVGAELPHAASDDDVSSADHELCLVQMLGSPDKAWRSGEQKLMGELLAEALRTPALEAAALRRNGVMICNAKGGPPKAEDELYIAVSNTHSTMAQHFIGTRWQGEPGASSPWRQSLDNFPGALSSGTLSFAGHKSRAVLLPAINVIPYLGDATT